MERRDGEAERGQVEGGMQGIEEIQPARRHRAGMSMIDGRHSLERSGGGALCGYVGKSDTRSPISGTGTICTSTWKSGPSLTTTPALHSFGMSYDGVALLVELILMVAQG